MPRSPIGPRGSRGGVRGGARGPRRAIQTDIDNYPNQISLIPNDVALILNGTTQLLAVIINPDGVVLGLGHPAYASGDTGICTVSATGLVTATGVGNTTITATVAAYAGSRPTPLPITINVVVTNPTPTLLSIAVSPVSGGSATVNSTQQYTVMGTYSSGPPAVPAGVVWSVFSGGGSITAGGLATRPSGAGTQVIRATVGALTNDSSTTITALPPPPPPSPGAPVLEELWTGYADSATMRSNFNGQGAFARTFGDYFGGHAGFFKKTTTNPYPAFTIPGSLFTLENDSIFGKCCGMHHMAVDAFPLLTQPVSNGPTSVMRWNLPQTYSRLWIERYFRLNDISNRYTDGASPSASLGWITLNPLATPPTPTGNAYKLWAENYVGGAANGATSYAFNGGLKWRVVINNTNLYSIDWHDHGDYSQQIINNGSLTKLNGNNLMSVGAMPIAAPNSGWFRTIRYFHNVSTTELILGDVIRRYSDNLGNLYSEAAQPWYGIFKRFIRTTGLSTCPVGINALVNGQNQNTTTPFSQTVFHGPTRMWDAISDPDPMGILAQFGVTP